MNIDLPVVQTTLGPDWATDLNVAIGGPIDSHDHSTGKGVKITPSGMDVNQDITLNSHNAINIRSVRCDSQTAALTAPADVNAIYIVNGELYYRDTIGNNVQITSNGGINISSVGTIGGDYGQPGVPASVVYSNTTKAFSFTRIAGSGADIVCSTLKVTDPTVGSQSIGITASPTAVAYTITLPDDVPAVNGSLVTAATTGALSYTTTLTADITQSGNWVYSGAPTVGGSMTRIGTTTGGTYSNITLSNTTTNSGTISGGTISGSTISGATLSSTTTNSGTISGGTISGATESNIAMSGTWSGNPTFSGNLTLTNGPVVSSVTASTIAAFDSGKALVTASTTGTGSTAVLATAPSISGATLTNTTTNSGTINGGTVSAVINSAATSSGCGLIPLGGIIATASNLTGAYNCTATTTADSNGFVQCNGQTISDVTSPMNGVTIPNINNDVFLMGSTTSGTTGGANTKDISHTHTSAAHTHTSTAHTHSIVHNHQVAWSGTSNGFYMKDDSNTSTTSWTSDERNIFTAVGDSSTSGSQKLYPGDIFVGVAYTYYSSGVLNAPSGSGSTAVSGSTTPGDTGSTTPGATGTSLSSTQDFRPNYISSKFVIRIK